MVVTELASFGRETQVRDGWDGDVRFCGVQFEAVGP